MRDMTSKGTGKLKLRPEAPPLPPLLGAALSLLRSRSVRTQPLVQRDLEIGVRHRFLSSARCVESVPSRPRIRALGLRDTRGYDRRRWGFQGDRGEPAGDGVRITYIVDFHHNGLYRPAGPLLALVMRRNGRRRARKPQGRPRPAALDELRAPTLDRRRAARHRPDRRRGGRLRERRPGRARCPGRGAPRWSGSSGAWRRASRSSGSPRCATGSSRGSVLDLCIEDAARGDRGASGAERTLLLGFSMGGAVAIAAAGEPRVERGARPGAVDPRPARRLAPLRGQAPRRAARVARPLAAGDPRRRAGALARAASSERRRSASPASYTLIRGGVHGVALRSPGGRLVPLPRAADAGRGSSRGCSRSQAGAG